MNTYFKTLFLVVVFPLLTLIAGCNSEGAFSESTIKLERIDIIASPITTKGVSQLTLAVGNKQPFEAIGHYDDGSSRTLTDLTVSDWHTSDPDVGRFDEPGVFTATNEGNTTLTATKDGVTSNTVDVTVSAAVITSIQVTPSPVNIAKGQTQQLIATATFSDTTSSDISSSVTWGDFDTATVTVSSTGLLSAVKAGNTTLTATKDGVTSNTVDVNVCADFAGTCIDIFDTGSGKLFTNSPSVAYLDSIGGSATNGTGQIDSFYVFNWTNANALCTTYRTLSLGGRTNWSLATKSELKEELYGVFGNMVTARGWPTNPPEYWSATSAWDIYYYVVNLSTGREIGDTPNAERYATCVSTP
ncbi:Ig-like domain-containing protein [Vibrio campbellii]|uniref:Ig-like domain-containing protein n=1 Tax=Vibrio campbellii TaxID=680 RepID=UPI00249A710D|nr:Ig-like domain-containing protein [Vibrio campbellii]